VAEQGARRGAAQSAEALQLRPPALDQVLLHVFGVREGGVKEHQQVVPQDVAAHVAAVRTAVAGNALVESAWGGKEDISVIRVSADDLNMDWQMFEDEHILPNCCSVYRFCFNWEDKQV